MLKKSRRVSILVFLSSTFFCISTHKRCHILLKIEILQEYQNLHKKGYIFVYVLVISGIDTNSSIVSVGASVSPIAWPIA